MLKAFGEGGGQNVRPFPHPAPSFVARVTPIFSKKPIHSPQSASDMELPADKRTFTKTPVNEPT